MTKSFATPLKPGRQVGTRPKPKPATVADFVEQALAEPITPPPPAPKPPRNLRRKAGIWEDMTSEQRSAHARKLAAMRKPENMRRTCQRTGTPKTGGWTHESAAVAKAAARMEAEQLVAKLQADGTIAPDDLAGAKATVEALTAVRSPGSKTERVKWARRLLRHYTPDMAGVL